VCGCVVVVVALLLLLLLTVCSALQVTGPPRAPLHTPASTVAHELLHLCRPRLQAQVHGAGLAVRRRQHVRCRRHVHGELTRVCVCACVCVCQAA
jgi:hypothetical protein